MQEFYVNNNKIKENKYKILRMSLILDSSDNKEQLLSSFEESAREIDAMNDETYLKEIEDKFYDTLKLEEEEQKLTVLVNFIEGRLEQRLSLLSDFSNITGYDLSGLPPIKYYDKLDDYKERLKYIKEYLTNIDAINRLTLEIEESEQSLQDAYNNKNTSEEYNLSSETSLLTSFITCIKNIQNVSTATIDNIDELINNILTLVEESKKSLDIFSKSYHTLRGSGISYEEENEYKSYVDNAKEVFYNNKEQEYLLRIYKVLFTKEQDYQKIISKRDYINEIINDRLALREELDINGIDILTPLYELLKEQYKDIEAEKVTIDSIEYLTKLIEVKKEDKAILELANQKVEILALLREFCIIDTYEELATPELTPKEEQTQSLEFQEIESTEPKQQEEIDIPTDLFMPNNKENTSEDTPLDNEIISVKDATSIDITEVQAKASKVMQRVGEMLGIKPKETSIVNVTTDELTTPAIPNPFLETTLEQQPPEVPANPLFNTNFNQNLETSTTTSDPEDDNNFWFPSDTPDALNDLPDLEVPTNNFFGDNTILDLNFPEINLNFGPNEEEN